MHDGGALTLCTGESFVEGLNQVIVIGSGVAEAACKTLVAQRLKRSGMRWRIVGGQAVLTFRAQIKSGLFDRAWAALMGTLLFGAQF